MNNPRLMGVPKIDNFNLRGSMCVVAMYGVITIISYFNELNKAGLLQRGVYPKPLAHYKTRMERSVDIGKNIENNVNIHSLGLEILKIKKDPKHKKKNHHRQEEINIKVHLGKNGSYEKINNSVVQVYDHKNTLPNFYTSLNLTFVNLNTTRLGLGNVSLISNLTSVLNRAEGKRKAYRKATLVFMYQNDPDTLTIKDCLKNISQDRSVSLNSLAINSHNRKQWETMSRRRKDAFHILYGDLAFGVCETVGRSCNYLTLVSHPLDRLVALHQICRTTVVGTMKSLCRSVDAKKKSLRDFIVAQGSGFFQMLVYYAKHCRLIGEDEICLQDSRTSFIFTDKEVDLHLKHVLEHLESWFGAVGLLEKLPESLDLFQKIYGRKFMKCYNERLSHLKNGTTSLKSQDLLPSGKLSKHRRAQLLNDTAIAKALAPDLAIYNKLVDIFDRQFLYKKALKEHEKSLRVLSAKKKQTMIKVPVKKATEKKDLKLVESLAHKKGNAKKPVKHNVGQKSLKQKLKFSPGKVGHLEPPNVRNALNQKQIKNSIVSHKKGTALNVKSQRKAVDVLVHTPLNPRISTKIAHQKKGNSTKSVPQNQKSHKNATKLIPPKKVPPGKIKPLAGKHGTTHTPVAGMDALLYQNYSLLEHFMTKEKKKPVKKMGRGNPDKKKNPH